MGPRKADGPLNRELLRDLRLKQGYVINREFMMLTSSKTLFEANIDASTEFEMLLPPQE